MHPVGDFLGNNEDIDMDNPSDTTEKKRKGRGVTKKDDIFSRTPDMPKITILLNHHGQPIGENARKLSSVIGCQVRKGLSLASMDWRLVDDEKKYKLWTDIKAFYDIHDDAFNWFMRTARSKWKEFKATIKTKYFNPDMTMEEVGQSRDKRINDVDWTFLFNYWLSAEFKVRSEIAKANHAKLQLHHTSGSVSYACSEYDLAKELGRPPRRDENFIKTHTRKNGVPSQEAAPIIDQLKEIVEVYPELKERTIEEGDAFATVCGQKEPKGYVRVLGLGPTPQDICTPGLKCYAPTRLKMEILKRKKVESEKLVLEERVDELHAKIDREQRAQKDRRSSEPMSHNGSTSRQQVMPNITLQDIADPNEEDAFEDEQCDYDDDQDIPSHLHGSGQIKSSTLISTAPSSHNDSNRSIHNALVGKEVILYALLRSEQPVAKGTIISTKPSTVIAGEALGREFCEIIVTCVLKRDQILPRPYANIKTMGDANMMSVAWPYEKLKINKKASTPPSGV